MSENAASALSDAKKVAAAATKSALSLVETYTATQLDIDLRQLGVEEHKLSEQDLEAATKLARTPDQEALPPLAKISIASPLAEIWREAGLLLVQAPEVAGAIQRLTENPQIANWVERGLALHEHADACEFCGNDVAAQRLEQLRSHFSTAQAVFKASIETLLVRARASRAAKPLPSAHGVYPQFRERFDQAGSKLLAAMTDHDQIVAVLEGELAAKRDDPFGPRTLQPLSLDPAQALRVAAEELNTVIAEHNVVADHFKAEKAKAIRRAKLHYAQLFDEKQELAIKARKQERFKERIAKIRRMGEILDARKRELEAQINQAQKKDGRRSIVGFKAF